MSNILASAPLLAPFMDMDRRPSLSLTNTTSNDSPPSADGMATTPPQSPTLEPITISRCNSATGEQEETESEIAQDVAPPMQKAVFAPPPPQLARGRAEGQKKIGALSLSRSMGSLRPKSRNPIGRESVRQPPTTAAMRPKPQKTNSFSAFFRKLVGSSSPPTAPRLSHVPANPATPVPMLRSTPAAFVTPAPLRRATATSISESEKPSTSGKPSLAIDTTMAPQSSPPLPEAVAKPQTVNPCEIPLPASPNPYNIALPLSPSLNSIKELSWTLDDTALSSPLTHIKRSISMNIEDLEDDDEDDDDVGSLSGLGSEESEPLSPMPTTPATPVLIHRNPPQSIPQEFGGGSQQPTVTRSLNRWRTSVVGLSSSLPLRKASRSAGPPPSSYDAYEAQQRSRANNRRSCQPTMHTRSTLAAETREVMDKEQEEMMERFFMS